MLWADEEAARLRVGRVRDGGRHTPQPFHPVDAQLVARLAFERAAVAATAHAAAPVDSPPPCGGVPKLPLGRAANVEVPDAAPRAVVPRPALQLVVGPVVVHRHLNAHPGAQFALDFADIAGICAETRPFGGDDTRYADVERRTAREQLRLPDGVRRILPLERVLHGACAA